MTSLYVRWVILFIVAVILGILTYDHYQKNLAAWVPSQVQTQQPTQQIRVLGMVQGGTLKGNVNAGHATFQLIENEIAIQVHYKGPKPDNLRELKTMILIGKWNTSCLLYTSPSPRD